MTVLTVHEKRLAKEVLKNKTKKPAGFGLVSQVARRCSIDLKVKMQTENLLEAARKAQLAGLLDEG